MQNQQNKPQVPMPRRDIPESWVKNGRCPACESSNLKVTRFPDAPDYLSCTKCGISFEVENGGRYVRLKHIPVELEFVDAILRNRWVEAVKLAGVIAKHRPAVPGKKVPDQPPVASPADDAWKRALRMYELGNNPRAIHAMLTQSGLDQEQVGAIFARLKKVVEDDSRQQNKKFLLVAGISIFILFLLTGTWLTTSGKIPVLMGMVTVTPAPTISANQPSAIGMLMKILPSKNRPDFANLPNTTVETGKGLPRAACPATPETAAQLFGGDPQFWYRDMEDFPSWQMISPADSTIVKVPIGMTVGYVDNETFDIRSVPGPATLSNVNFLVITCD